MQKIILPIFTLFFLFWLSPNEDLSSFLNKPFGKYSIEAHSTTNNTPTSRKSSNSPNISLKRIVIDPGHGGRDGGCSGKNSKEKHIALSVAKKLGGIINTYYPEIEVIYTRTRDRFIPLHQRAYIANSKKADLFISLHCNAIRIGSSVRGSETYVMGLHTAKENLDVTKRENESILLEEDHQHNYTSIDPNSPEGHILLSSYQNAYLDQSIMLATEIEKEIKRQALGKSHGVKQAGFHVLRMTAMPSVLVEMGFLTNSHDESFLRSTSGQNKMANALFTAFQNYKYKVELNNTPTIVADNEYRERTKAVITQPAPTRSTVPASTNQVEYRVQIASFRESININKGKWLLVDYIIEEAEEDGRVRYFATGFEDVESAQNAQLHLRRIGFDDAFLVQYVNGRRAEFVPTKAKSLGY